MSVHQLVFSLVVVLVFFFGSFEGYSELPEIGRRVSAKLRPVEDYLPIKSEKQNKKIQAIRKSNHESNVPIVIFLESIERHNNAQSPLSSSSSSSGTSSLLSSSPYTEPNIINDGSQDFVQVLEEQLSLLKKHCQISEVLSYYSFVKIPAVACRFVKTSCSYPHSMIVLINYNRTKLSNSTICSHMYGGIVDSIRPKYQNNFTATLIRFEDINSDLIVSAKKDLYSKYHIINLVAILGVLIGFHNVLFAFISLLSGFISLGIGLLFVNFYLQVADQTLFLLSPIFFFTSIIALTIDNSIFVFPKYRKILKNDNKVCSLFELMMVSIRSLYISFFCLLLLFLPNVFHRFEPLSNIFIVFSVSVVSSFLVTFFFMPSVFYIRLYFSRMVGQNNSVCPDENSEGTISQTCVSEPTGTLSQMAERIEYAYADSDVNLIYEEGEESVDTTDNESESMLTSTSMSSSSIAKKSTASLYHRYFNFIINKVPQKKIYMLGTLILAPALIFCISSNLNLNLSALAATEESRTKTLLKLSDQGFLSDAFPFLLSVQYLADKESKPKAAIDSPKNINGVVDLFKKWSIDFPNVVGSESFLGPAIYPSDVFQNYDLGKVYNDLKCNGKILGDVFCKLEERFVLRDSHFMKYEIRVQEKLGRNAVSRWLETVEKDINDFNQKNKNGAFITIAGGSYSIFALKCLVLGQFELFLAFSFFTMSIALALLLKSWASAFRIMATLIYVLIFSYGYAGILAVLFMPQVEGVYWLLPVLTLPLIMGMTVEYDVFTWVALQQTIKDCPEKPLNDCLVDCFSETCLSYITACTIVITTYIFLLLSPLIIVKQFALVVVLSVFCDMFIIRCLLLPVSFASLPFSLHSEAIADLPDFESHSMARPFSPRFSLDSETDFFDFELQPFKED